MFPAKDRCQLCPFSLHEKISLVSCCGSQRQERTGGNYGGWYPGYEKREAMRKDSLVSKLRRVAWISASVATTGSLMSLATVAAIGVKYGGWDPGYEKREDIPVCGQGRQMIGTRLGVSEGTRSVACQDSNPGPLGSESSTLPLRHTTPQPYFHLCPVSRLRCSVSCLDQKRPADDSCDQGTRSVACQDSNPGPLGSESSTLPHNPGLHGYESLSTTIG
ncbi:hypothetical protein Bbelb_120160 [Branchiostoma belcheri]|nr:hypothetical protein Bbelb_120160 [Branchiostoma belcheri]